MEARATARFVRMTPRKVRFVMDTIRGKYADDALAQLKFTPNHAADEIANVLRSAMANAENNHNMNADILKVTRCFVDGGPTLKRVQPRAQGRAYRILKRTSHITVIVEEEPRPRPQAPPVKKVFLPLRAALPTPAAAPAEDRAAQEIAEETTAATMDESTAPETATTADEATFPAAPAVPETTEGAE